MQFEFNEMWPQQLAGAGLLEQQIEVLIDSCDESHGQILKLFKTTKKKRHPLEASVHELKGWYRNLGVVSCHDQLQLVEKLISENQITNAEINFQLYLQHFKKHIEEAQPLWANAK